MRSGATPPGRDRISVKGGADMPPIRELLPPGPVREAERAGMPDREDARPVRSNPIAARRL